MRHLIYKFCYLSLWLAFFAKQIRAEPSLDELLEQANHALDQKSHQIEIKPKTAVKKKKNRKLLLEQSHDKVQGKFEISTRTLDTYPSEEASQKPVDKTPSPLPVSGANQDQLADILNIEARALTIERNRSIEDFGLSFGGGTSTLQHQSLFKDDDYFEAVPGSRLYGGELKAELIAWNLSQDYIYSSKIALGLGFGFFEGSIPVDRTGVQSGRKNYSRQLYTPNGFVEFRHRFLLVLQPFIRTGLSFDLVRQIGSADYDTELDGAFHDFIEIGNRIQLSHSSAFRLFATYAWHGARFVNSHSDSNYQTILAGVEWRMGYKPPSMMMNMQADGKAHAF